MSTRCVPEWAESAVFYQIYPQTFSDANGDGIGDLPGIIAKLDHVVSLGATAIWLNPFYPSPMRDAGYDVADYRGVDPRYGTMDDIRRLFREAHARGLRVIVDFVPGHTSIDHAWFGRASEQTPNEYSNWYIWTRSAWDDGGEDWRAKMVHGYSDRNGNYLINFFWSQPALNFGFANPDPARPWQLATTHPDVRRLWDEMRDTMRFWMEQGADGFRVDMAGSITRRDPDGREARRFWAEAREACEAVNPDYFTVAEWSHPTNALDGRGLHADFLHWIPSYEDLFRKENFRTPGAPERPPGHSWFDREGKGDIRRFIDDYLVHLRATRGKGCISIPVGNHDLPRIGIGRDDDDLAVIFAFLLTMPGVPFIYYGDEIGMRHLAGLPTKEGSYPPRTGARTPMQWDSGVNAGFSNAPSEKLWYPVDDGASAPNVAEQETRAGSLLQRVRELNRLRRKIPALRATAEFEPVYCESGAYPFIYLRGTGSERVLVALNPSGRRVKAFVPRTLSVRAVLAGASAVFAEADGGLGVEMPPASFVIADVSEK